MKRHTSISRLLTIAGPKLSDSVPVLPPEAPKTFAAYVAMLTRLNGFYAFDSALHVFPMGKPIDEREFDVDRWNSDGLWRHIAGEYAVGLTFFAEDVFGEQFAIRGDEIVRYNPETGECHDHASTLEAWAEKILDRFEFETGVRLAHEWQKANRALAPGKRLLPSTPFVLGGEYKIENLYDGDAVEGMIFRSDLAHQVRHIPDGATVRLVITE